jgi:hypothetical protein
MHGSVHVSGTYRWKKRGGGRRGVLVFEGGESSLPLPGVGSALPPLRACPQPSDGTSLRDFTAAVEVGLEHCFTLLRTSAARSSEV